MPETTTKPRQTEYAKKGRARLHFLFRPFLRQVQQVESDGDDYGAYEECVCYLRVRMGMQFHCVLSLCEIEKNDG